MLRQFRIKSKQNLITMQVYSWKITCSVIFKLTRLYVLIVLLLYSVPCLILYIRNVLSLNHWTRSCCYIGSVSFVVGYKKQAVLSRRSFLLLVIIKWKSASIIGHVNQSSFFYDNARLSKFFKFSLLSARSECH